jgi:hypothetical protein
MRGTSADIGLLLQKKAIVQFKRKNPRFQPLKPFTRNPLGFTALKSYKFPEEKEKNKRWIQSKRV